MTVSNTTTKLTYQGDGLNRRFDISFPFISTSDIKVILTEDGHDNVLTQGYEIDASKTFLTYPVDTTKPAITTGVKLTVMRSTPSTQELDLEQQATLHKESLEKELDKLTYLVQELRETTTRTVTAGVTENLSNKTISEILNEIQDTYNEVKQMAETAGEEANKAIMAAIEAFEQAEKLYASVEYYDAGTAKDNYTGSLTEVKLLNDYNADGKSLKVFVNGSLARCGVLYDYQEVIDEEKSTTRNVGNIVRFNSALTSGDALVFMSADTLTMPGGEVAQRAAQAASDAEDQAQIAREQAQEATRQAQIAAQKSCEFLSVQVGQVIYSQSSRSEDNPGALPLFTGETVNKSEYTALYNWVNEHSYLQCSSSSYEEKLATYGECPFYVLTSSTLRLPKLTNFIKNANTTDGITQKDAGLPNITGTLPGSGDTDWPPEGLFTGAFRRDDTIASSEGFDGTRHPRGTNFDASRVSSIYGNSNTVTPSHTTLFPWVIAFNAVREGDYGAVLKDYTKLDNKPTINGVTLTGNKTTSQLGIVIPTKTSEITNDSNFVNTTELNTALSTKQDALSSAAMSAVNSGITSTKVATYEAYATGKQDTLVSATNIKTINGKSVLGAGNLVIEGTDTSIVSLGFDGTLESGVLEFNPPTSSGTYDIQENHEYELDLHFAVSGTVDDDVEIEIVNDSEMIQFWSVNHTDTTTSIKWKNFKEIAVYDDDNGYRWLFKATCRIMSTGIKAFIIYPTLNKEIDLSTKQDKLTAGEGITISDENVISATASVPENVYTRDNLLAGTNIEIIPEPVEGGIDEYTIACWHCDNNLIDAKNNIKINQFDVRIDSENKKFGSSSLRNFERGAYWTDGYIGSFQANISQYGLSTSSNLTVDFWLKLNYRSYYTYSGGAIEYAGFNHSNKNPFGLKWDWNDEEKKVKFGDVLGTDWSNEIQLDNYGEWHHIEYNYEASSKTSRIFFDGNKIKETLLSGVQEFNINYFNLYRDQLNYQPENNADEIRISNTVRHTSNFTPMTQAYSVAEPTGKYVINSTGGGGGGSVPTLTWLTNNTGTEITQEGLSTATLVKVYKNGLLLEPTEDYTITDNTITFVSSLEATDKITLEVY